ncbi:MAG: glycoside hydrolase family 18 [Bacillota bacterium]|nr:MAG: glycoside hydrolase family 18 [Bacillota bacterium]
MARPPRGPFGSTPPRPPHTRRPGDAPGRYLPARSPARPVLAGLLLAALMLLAGCAGLLGREEARPKPGTGPRDGGRDPVVYGFYTEPEPEAGLPGSLETMRRHARDLDVIVPFWFRLTESGDGTIEPYGAPEAARRREVIAEAHRRGIRVELILHNLLYGSGQRSAETARRFLRDEAAQERAARGILDLIRQEGYDGVHIDLESVPPEERPRLTGFVRRVRQALPRGKLLSIAVFPRDREDRDDRNTGAYDYAALGRLVDAFILMTYSEHTAETGPGPLASRDYADRMLRYAVQHVPREKILLGLGGFGFDWGGSGLPRYLSHAQAVDLARQRSVPVRWDNAAQVPFFTYSENGEDHAVYFEDARSWAAKLELARRYGVGGVAIWRLGMEDEGGWREISRLLR